MTLYHLGWNQTHRGHYLKADQFKQDLTREQLKDQLWHLIDTAPRTCRIWIDGRCVWYYDDATVYCHPVGKIVDDILKGLP